MDIAENADGLVDLTAEDDCVSLSLPRNDSNNSENADQVFRDICNENKLVAEFLKKCINMEKSEGMEKIINYSFIKCYREADEQFKVSSKFYKSMRRALYLLETDPYHKFSHIKNLCDIIKAARVKKRVQLATLENNVTDKQQTLDNHVINLDEHDEDIEMDDVPIQINTENNDNIIVDLNREENSMAIDEDSLLVPKITSSYSILDNQRRIRELEKEIESLKQIIDDLDTEEVTVDSTISPYIRSESLKAKIVTLYEELCQLTGDEAVKKRTIRLKVLPGHPKGPARRLERFLNNKIGKDGAPPFPDFMDVVECVLTANRMDSLGWSKQQIKKEATALFTQCGQALQKLRQTREWQDLLYKVKLNDFPRDPADDDPQLLARLEANRKLAREKESDILKRYSMMQTKMTNRVSFENITNKDKNVGKLPTAKKNRITPLKIINSDKETTRTNNNTCRVVLNNIDDLLNNSVDIHSDGCVENIRPSQLYCNEREGLITNNENTHSKASESVKESDFNDNNVLKKSTVANTTQKSNEKSEEILPSENKADQRKAGKSLGNSTQNQFDPISKTEVQEPEDIVKTLNEFGEDYTLTVVIEDPFLTIEVSCDSSEDEQD